MSETVHTNFPSQVVSDLEKESFEYGLKVAQAIEQEWFLGPRINRHYTLKNKFQIILINYDMKNNKCIY